MSGDATGRWSETDLVLSSAFVSLEFKEEVLRKKYEEETGSLAEERARQEAEEHRALMAWNNEENLRLLQQRWEETRRDGMKNENLI